MVLITYFNAVSLLIINKKLSTLNCLIMKVKTCFRFLYSKVCHNSRTENSINQQKCETPVYTPAFINSKPLGSSIHHSNFLFYFNKSFCHNLFCFVSYSLYSGSIYNCILIYINIISCYRMSLC